MQSTLILQKQTPLKELGVLGAPVLDPLLNYAQIVVIHTLPVAIERCPYITFYL